MQNPMDLIKRAPKWAVWTGGGVIIGGVALRMYKSKTTADTENVDTGNSVSPTVVGSPGYTSSAPGIVTPPVIINQPAVDQSGTGLGDLQQLYHTGVTGVFDAFSGAFSQLSGNWSQTASQNADITAMMAGTVSQIALNAGAGAAPQPVLVNPTPVVTAVPMPAPAAPQARPAPAPAFTTVFENRTRDNGLKGAARKVWCSRVEIHRYPNKPAVVVNETKVKNGAC